MSFLILLCLFSKEMFSQESSIKNLVFEGAGIRGLAYSGVINELEKKGIIKNIENVAGTSAGAITAMMLSIGYSSQEISEIISTTKFQKFNDGRFFFIGGMFRVKNSYGWYRGDSFSKWIEKLIINKTGNGDMTFNDLNKNGYKNLFVTGTCLNKQKLIIFSHTTYPDMKIKDAVRISMSIPLYYKAVLIDSVGKVYKKPKQLTNLDIVVDGGIVGNYPIFIFDQFLTDSLNNSIRIPNPETVGIRIDSELQIRNDSLSKELVPINIDGFNDYISAFYIFIIENLNRPQLIKDDWQRTISVSSVEISPRVKRLSKSQKQSLINSGITSTSKYLKQNHKH
ncbi:MAG: patatin-like phospholipase family protein [Bacteroidota bacterium]|nr:patatin-like phospholipase family protein [Bacteroidota bacterium]